MELIKIHNDNQYNNIIKSILSRTSHNQSFSLRRGFIPWGIMIGNYLKLDIF